MQLPQILVRLINKFKLLPLFNLKTTIVVNNRNVIIPIIAKQGLNNIRLSEPWMTDVLKKLRPVFNNHFVDVGVNIGQTLVKAYGVFDNVNYIGFEPNPVCYNYSKKLIELNNFSNCSIVPVGISGKDEVVQLLFFHNDTADSSATIVKDFRDESTVIKKEFVPVFHGTALTQFLPTTIGSILKIDVEGAELEVIEGLRTWINNTRPIILIEVLPVYTIENKFRLQRQELICTYLKQMNFIITRIMKNDNKVSLFELDTFDINQEIENSDYIFIPAERTEEIMSLFNN